MKPQTRTPFRRDPVIRAAVTAATPVEMAILAEALGDPPRSVAGVRETCTGKIGRVEILLCVTGMGKINAASAATSIIEGWGPDLLINTGCAGAYRGAGISVGDLVLATAEIAGDEGVETTCGWKPYDFIGIPAVERNGKRYFNEFPLSLAPTERANRLASALGVPHRRGKFVTVSCCSGTARRGDELYGRFGALCENMEGAAFAQVALHYGVDCMEVRGISNMVEDRDLSRWDIRGAVERAQRFLIKYFEHMEER